MKIKDLTQVPVSFSDLKPYPSNPGISMARCRIFYKGANINGGFITDGFAQKLISSIQYTPVKGIYENGDFGHHAHGIESEERKERIYGVVPENYHLEWEDVNGKSYATVDVLLYTELYKEACSIPGHPESFELFIDGIEGDFQTIDGEEYFVYTDGYFKALQVLGYDVAPAFEDASFLAEFQKKKEDERDAIEQILMKAAFEKRQKGESSMDKKALEALLGESKEAENKPAEFEDQKKKEDETDPDTEDEDPEKKKDEAEKAEAEKEKPEEQEKKKSECEVADYEKAIVEFSAKVKSLESKIAEFESKIVELQEANTTLKAENSELSEFQAKKISEEKQTVLAGYKDMIPANKYAEFEAKLGEYETAESLDKDLAYVAVKSCPTSFSKQTKEEKPGYVPKEQQLTGLDALFAKMKGE